MSENTDSTPIVLTDTLRNNVAQMTAFGNDLGDVLHYLGALSLDMVNDIYDDPYDQNRVEALLRSMS